MHVYLCMVVNKQLYAHVVYTYIRTSLHACMHACIHQHINTCIGVWAQRQTARASVEDPSRNASSPALAVVLEGSCFDDPGGKQTHKHVSAHMSSSLSVFDSRPAFSPSFEGITNPDSSKSMGICSPPGPSGKYDECPAGTALSLRDGNPLTWKPKRGGALTSGAQKTT